MLATCPICCEDLGGVHTAAAMPCGHLYCYDCATFWFNQGDSPQACVLGCGNKYTGGQVIKLWSTTDGNAESSRMEDAERRGVNDPQAEQVLQACESAASSTDVDEDEDVVLTDALTRTETFVERMSEDHDHVGVQRILKTIRGVLADIRSLLLEKARRRQGVQSPTSPSTSRANTASEVVRMRAKLQQDIQEILSENLATEEEHERQREELQVQLDETRRVLERVREKLESTEARNVTLQDENDRLRKSELRYKKKYLALKQDVRASKRRAGGEREDDSLVVI